MKKIIHKMSQVVQMLLLAPVKLPSKVLQVMKYVAIGLGVIETVLKEEDDDAPLTAEKEGDPDA